MHQLKTSFSRKFLFGEMILRRAFLEIEGNSQVEKKKVCSQSAHSQLQKSIFRTELKMAHNL
jgi:hypothetical protein